MNEEMPISYAGKDPWFTGFDLVIGVIRDLFAGFGLACVLLWALYFFWWKV